MNTSKTRNSNSNNYFEFFGYNAITIFIIILSWKTIITQLQTAHPYYALKKLLFKLHCQHLVIF